jgi:histidine triad (HIT) family protein
MASIFTRIIRGEIPSIRLFENEFAIAIMDVFPLRKGHVLIIPKMETDLLFDLDDNILCELMILSKRLAKAMKKALDCQRIGLSVIGLEIPHAHIHLVPINDANDINFAQQKLAMDSAEIQEIADKIKNELKIV